jgi:ATP-binding protein involved in chromosome partitioning
VGKMVSEEDVLKALGAVIEPELRRDLVSLNMIRDVVVGDGRVSFTIMLTTPACPLIDQMRAEAYQAVAALPGVSEVEIAVDASVPSDQRIAAQINLPFRNTIAVASGKGGVGKSTVATNMAIALADAGASVGLMDADIYGPNVPLMLGVSRVPAPRDGKIIPAVAHGLRVMSMGFLVPPNQPVIWRGPMIHSAVQQFLTDVDWGQLDYLVIDLPPGTGDAQLTLAQSVPLTGAVIVTTPQDVALADAIKGVGMFQQLGVTVLGIVENMGTFVCPHCGAETSIFGNGGGARMAERLGVPFLGSVPIDPAVRIGGDEGKPIVLVAPESPAGAAFRRLARQVAAQVSVMHLAESGR